ncbi:MAG: histidine phosphatase family protein [Deltaproteobacteria bacterium]
MTTKIIFVRHGEAKGNFERVFHGQTDSDLTEKGHKQAQKTAERLKSEEIDVIYSSPLKRAFQTAQYIAGTKNIEDIIANDGLMEINGGKWENIRWEELPDKFPEEYYNWEHCPHLHCMPAGESMKQAYDRIVDAVINIVNENKGRSICIVTHGTVLRALICHIKSKPLEDLITVSWCDNTAITIVEFVDNAFKVILEGDNSHLGNELSTFATQDWWQDK